MLTTGKSLTKTTTIIASAVLALSLAACGSESNDAGSGDKTTAPAASSSQSTDASTGTGDSGGTGGMVPDDQWAAAFKKAVPPLKDTPDADIVAAGKKVCSDFKASPTAETAKGIVKETSSTFKLDSVQANIFTGGVIAHFCNDQGEKFLTASIG